MKSIFTFFLLIAVFVIKPATAHAQAADTGDSLALVDLYDSTGGTAWTHHTNWLTTAAVQTWYGVTLDADGRVTKLLLDSNNLVGTLPSSIGVLVKMQYLYLNTNQLSGWLPGTGFNNYTRLKLLDLRDNYFTFDGTELLTAGIIKYTTFIPQKRLFVNISGDGKVLSVSAGGTYANDIYYWNESTKGVHDSTFTIGKLAPNYGVAITNTNLPYDATKPTVGFMLFGQTHIRVPIVNFDDSLALVNFYNLTNGAGWTDHTNWLTTAPVSTWKGVTVDSNNRVMNIILPGNNLTGVLPFLTFPELIDTLNLNNNQIGGSFAPDSYGSAFQFYGLPLLTDLEIAHNNLTGFLPDFKEANLATLNLSYNNLRGAIKIEAPNQQHVYLDHNHFDSGIISNYRTKKLKIFDVRDNYLNFDGLHSLSQDISPVLKFQPQHFLILHLNSHTLSVTATGAYRQSYVDYSWYKDATFLQTITGDSTLVVTQPGHYSVIVTDEDLPAGFELYSDTFEVTAAELPVKLTTFTGQLTHGQAFLNWQTASELNSSYFGVQRSTDGTNFTTVGKVAAARTSAVTKNYQYTDALTGLATMPAALYYRLQQVDKDGKQNLSKTIVLNPGANASSSLIMYPNPVRSLLNLRLRDVPGNAVITIVDAGGKTLLAQTAKTVTGGQTISLNTSRLAAGVYVVHVQYNGQSEEQKFIKE